jgi:hypothetical protein
MNNRFIYDEKFSSLYSPDGVFLKKLHCPKAMNWNQLEVNGDEQRWRNCKQCKERVLDLDVVDVQVVVKELQDQWQYTCVHVSSNSDRVVILKDPDAIPRPDSIKTDELPVVIRTARSLSDIERGVAMGYWPDVRFVEYDTENIQSKISVGQNLKTGEVDVSGDYRRRFGKKTSLLQKDDADSSDDYFEEVVPFTHYYQYYQDSPIAAYLIPRTLEDGSPVIVPDPIEDIVGSAWNQGSAYRAKDVRGHIENKKVVLGKHTVTISRFIG